MFKRFVVKQYHASSKSY